MLFNARKDPLGIERIEAQFETLVRWHRAGFRRYWRRKSRSLGGRPKIDAELRSR